MTTSDNRQPIELFDTTLRDGTQGEGVNLTVEDKVRITERMDDFGINIIEGGWPGSNPRDQEYFEKAKSLSLKQAQICAFGATAFNGANVKGDPNLNALLQSETPIVCLFGKTWRLHSELGLGIDETANAKLIRESVAYIVDNGRRVIFDAEHFFDGYRESPEFAMRMLEAAVQGGTDTLVLCDTNGGSLPWEIEEITGKVVRAFDVAIGIHAHNDSGFAEANSLIACSVGATHIQGTINGVGERCGNANLSTIMSNLTLKMDRKTKTPIQLEKLTLLNAFVYEAMNLHPNDRAPFVGKSAFAHKGGIHVSAVLKESRMYEHITPELVGNSNRVLISDLSGKSNVKHKARELNVKLSDTYHIPRDTVNRIKTLEHLGYQYETADASFELILREEDGTFTPYFDVLDSRIHVIYNKDGHNHADAMLKISVNGEIEHTVADGNGPVDALYQASIKALKRFYPELIDVILTDYKVRVLNGQQGTGAKVRVLIESSDGKENWWTVGVSENIIEASWQALRDSMNYILMKKTNGKKKR